MDASVSVLPIPRPTRSRVSTSISTKYIGETPVDTCVELASAAIMNDAKILQTIKPDSTGAISNILNDTRSIYGGTSDFSKGVIDRLDLFLSGEANSSLEGMFPAIINDTGNLVIKLANQPELQSQAILLFELQLRLFYNVLGCQSNETIKKFGDIIDSILNQIVKMLTMLKERRIIFSDTMKKFVEQYAQKVSDRILLADHLKTILGQKLI